VSNWGRWGTDDERGTLNLITAERVVEAARLIRTGKVFDLGIPLDSDGPQPGGGRGNPVRLMSATAGQVSPGAFRYADDYVFMPLQAASQWDALAHVFYDDQLYNGRPASSVDSRGAAHNSIDKISKGIAGRGVLLDIPRLLGLEWLEAGRVITTEDLDAAVAAQGVEVRPGDILLFRTGYRKKFLTERDRAAFMSGEPGIGLSSPEWLHDRQVAAIASDNWGIEVLPGEPENEPFAVHMVLIRDMGMTLGEMLDFEELAVDCAADGVWEFFFCGPPLKFTRGVGSPINPLAIK
jgi:kynurenine formamidase